MNIKKLFEGNNWVSVVSLNEKEHLIQTAFNHFDGKGISLRVTENDGTWVLSDDGYLLAQIPTKVIEDIRDATLNELQFNAIKLSFNVDDTVVSRTVQTEKELELATRWLLQWIIESNALLKKVVSIYEDALHSFGVNWTESKEKFEAELND